MGTRKTNRRGWSKLELLAKVRDIRRSNPAGVTFRITTRGRSWRPNRLGCYVGGGEAVSMDSRGIKLAATGNGFGGTISFAETMGISYTLPNNTQHRLY